jgi:transcription termination/antitermination protein NusA
MARTEFAAALNQICNERGISPEAVIESLKTALVAAFRKDFNDDFVALEEKGLAPMVDVDSESGEFRIFSFNPEDESVEKKDITPVGFGRIAAQTAKQVIFQQVREAEKTSIVEEYTGRIGEILTGQILRMDRQDVIVDLSRGQGVMPMEEQIRGEFYKLNSRITFVISDIRETYRGQTVIVSRADARLVSGLFAREVPEVGAGIVVIKAIARDAGVRTKLAVESTQEGVDPVGSCVGQKGVRVQAVINELNGERVDIIQFQSDPIKFIEASLAPAENLKIEINEAEKSANVIVPDDQLSLAIGRGGQNVKLAAKLTGYRLNLIGAESKTTASATGSEELEIDLLGLTADVRDKLVATGIIKIDQLLSKDSDQLATIEGLDEAAVDEIKKKLAAYEKDSTKA